MILYRVLYQVLLYKPYTRFFSLTHSKVFELQHNSILSSFIEQESCRIIRELNKEFPIYSYTLYTTDIQSVLIINSSTLMSIYELEDKCAINIYLDIILPASFLMFQTYDAILCNMLCNYGHMPLYCPRNQRKKIKSRKIDKKKRKSK